MNKQIWLTLIASTILVTGLPGHAVAQVTGPESRTGVAQSKVLTAADAAAKAASARKARPQAAIPGAKAGGTFQEVDFPGAFGTALEGINPQGDIVGNYTESNFEAHGFLLSKGAYTSIDAPGQIHSIWERGRPGSTRKGTSWGSTLIAAATSMVFC